MKYIDHIYVCHHVPLIERKLYLIDMFQRTNIEVEWVETYPPEKNNEHISAGEISLINKFIYCLQNAISCDYNNILILEDDVDIQFEFESVVIKCMEEFIEEDAEMLFLGVCCNLHFNVENKEKLIHYRPGLTTRCTHAMVLSKTTIKKIFNNKKLFEYNKPLDNKLNEIIIDLNLKNYWYEPGIEQLSVWKSSLRPEVKSKMSQIKNKDTQYNQSVFSKSSRSANPHGK